MGLARNLARLLPNSSGLLPNANIEAVAASKLTGQVADANAPSGSVVNYQLNTDTSTYTANPGSYTWMTVPNYGGTYTMQNTSNKLLITCQAHVASKDNQGCIRFQYSLNGGSSWTTFAGNYTASYSSDVHGQIFGFNNSLAHFIHVQNFALTPASSTVMVRLQGIVDGASDVSYNRTPNNIDQGMSGPSSVKFLEVTL